MSIVRARPADAPGGFRDLTASVDRDGAHKRLYPKQPHGRFYNARTIVSVFLLAFLFGAPLLRVNGHPLMLLNILERKFILFGAVFLPQDFYLLVLAILTLLVTVFLFTAVFGRVWCGWLCPQTVFLEMVFRRLEQWLEGDGPRQRRFDAAPLTPAKLARKTLKHIVFLALSFLIGNTFLAWIIGADQLWRIVTDPPAQHLTGLSLMLVFSALFYGVFAFFREQACVVVCPYGRYQSALVDQHTMVVAYDFKRGEPRGKLVRIASRLAANDPLPAHGDCVDCHQCVEVCPTGIDIRNGIQLECVNCTACIDACDTVMDKIKKPRGLIRHTSLTAIREGHARWLGPRVLAYAAIWLVVTSLFLYFFLRRPPAEALIFRQPGTMSQTVANGDLVNFFVLQLLNRQTRDLPVELRLLAPAGGSIIMLSELSVAPAVSARDARLLVSLPRALIHAPDAPITLGVYSEGRLLQTVETRFLAFGATKAKKEKEEKGEREHDDDKRDK
ncbi:MAG: cytochrome c oxidase accessory protein CcoG [Blastocatellia bacterium]